MDKNILNEDGIDLKDNKVCKFLFNMFFPRMFCFANSIVKDDDASADIVQDAFIYLLEKIRKFDNVPNFKSYLYLMVKARCFNHIRDSRKSLNTKDFKDIYYDDKDIEHIIIEKELKARILQEIDNLSDIKKDIMMLRLEGHTYDEISEELHLSINTIKSHRKQIHKTLRLRLSDYQKIIYFIIISTIALI